LTSALTGPVNDSVIVGFAVAFTVVVATSVVVAMAPASFATLSGRFSSDARCLDRNKKFVTLAMAATKWCKMFSTAFLAVTGFGLIDCVDSIGIRPPNFLDDQQASSIADSHWQFTDGCRL
jgi:hypothetical protein